MEKIFKETAEELELRKETVKQVFRHMFYSVAGVMKKGEFQNILLPGFGKWVVRPGAKERAEKLQRIYATKNNDNSEQVQDDTAQTVLEERDS